MRRLRNDVPRLMFRARERQNEMRDRVSRQRRTQKFSGDGDECASRVAGESRRAGGVRRESFGHIASLRLRRFVRWNRFRFAVALVLSMSLVSNACFESEEGETFYGRVVVPRTQEFRWSDGGVPRVFDPALAAAPPDTDVVRALFEGLTDYDPRNLAPVSAVATRWESSAGGRVWTFHLREDARWSNGDAVTAQDFVRSWRRTLRLADRAPHAKLLDNIEGAQSVLQTVAPGSQREEAARPAGVGDAKPEERQNAAARVGSQPREGNEPPLVAVAATAFGATALNDQTLRVHLQRPDDNFPALVAHPVFRPVHGLSDDTESRGDGGSPSEDGVGTLARLVSNGAFRLSSHASDSVVLERANNYWDMATVSLERVRFVASRDAEDALAAYRAGEVDAVTNAAFEPLALKLLAPYKDFRRATYGALTYYSFNTSNPPFDDVRVREALAIALDRERLSGDTLGGATEPARKFLPAMGGAEGVGTGRESDKTAKELVQNTERARQLLAEAGFPGGARFPRVRLLINRNEQQRLVAQAVANMWRNVLNVQTEVIVRGWDEYEAALRAGDFDVARRSVVMQTTDEETNLLTMFPPESMRPTQDDGAGVDGQNAEGNAAAVAANEPEKTGEPGAGGVRDDEKSAIEKSPPPPILTEAQALKELPGFPVYFASSYALVKPYVRGFEANLLDAPSLKHVRMDSSWKPPQKTEQIRVVQSGGR